MRRIGLFGGTFNPPTSAHEAVATAAYKELAFDKLLVLPNKQPPHKSLELDPGPDERLKLCQALCEGHPGWEAVDWEVRRHGASYIVDSLKELRRLYPKYEPWFVCGADSINNMQHWHRSQELAQLASFAVAPRGSLKIIPAAEHPLEGLRIKILSTPFDGELSSTFVRELIQSGGDITPYLPTTVAELVRKYGWYKPRRLTTVENSHK